MGKINNPRPAEAGTPGQRGTFRFKDTGAPGSVTGAIPGDEYLNVSNGDLWAMNSDGVSWALLGNLRGPEGAASTVPGPPSTEPGPPGPRGFTRFRGAANPVNVAGALAGDEYLNTTTADLYGYNGAAWTLLLNIRGPQGSAGTGTGGSIEPRGTGGTQFRLTTRSNAGSRSDLLPTSAVELFDDSLLAFIDANNQAILPGQTADVTGSSLVTDKTYYLDTPLGAGAPNLTAIPTPVPDGWPTVAVSNVDRRYKEVGRTWAHGGKLYLTLSTKPVVLSNEVAPTAKRVNVAGLAYDTDLIAGGVIVRMVQGAAQNGAAPRPKANGDAGVPVGFAASPIMKDVGGIQKGVMVMTVPFGADEYHYPADWDAQLGGEILTEFQSDSIFDTSRPRIFFCSSGGMVAGQLGTQYSLKVYSGTMAVVKSTSDGRTIFGDTTLSASVNVPFTANELWSFRLRVDEATKKVYVKAWKSGTAEPAAWQIDGHAIPELTAGRWGYAFRNGNNGWTRLALAPNGVTATHA